MPSAVFAGASEDARKVYWVTREEGMAAHWEERFQGMLDFCKWLTETEAGDPGEA